MALRTILQPHTGTFGETIHEELLEGRWTHLDAAVAFVRRSGARDIDGSLRTFLTRGGRVRIVAGLDLQGTSFEGLSQLMGALQAGDGTLSAVQRAPTGATFHPKGYLFRRVERDELVEARLLIGSTNLTGAALYLNDEAVASWSADLSEQNDRQTIEEVVDWAARLSSEVKPLNAEELLSLFRAGTVLSESVLLRRSWRGIRGRPRPKAKSAGARKLPAPKKQPGKPLVSLPEPARPNVGSSADSQENAGYYRWSKVLDRSAAQQPPSPDSSPTGVLRLSTSGHAIDRNTWFREKLFGNADWTSTRNRNGRPMDETIVELDVSIDGQNIGSYKSRVSHVPDRVAKQNNVPTTLHWGSQLGAILRATDYSGYTVEITRLENSYSLALFR